MWKIKGEEYHIGDSVFVARGIILPKVECYSIIKPRHRGSGGLFGGGWDGFAYASNGREVIRINKRGKIVDDIFLDERLFRVIWRGCVNLIQCQWSALTYKPDLMS